MATPPRESDVRLEEFKQSFGASTASQDLLGAAEILLRHALAERQSRAHPDGNINTPHAPGAVVLRMAAFEAFLNETLGILEFGFTGPKVKDLARFSIVKKYKDLFAIQKIRPCAETTELRLANSARNEVVHYYPRDRKVAKAMIELERRGLLIPSNFIGHGLESYALALWVFDVTHQYAVDLADALQVVTEAFFVPNLLPLAQNFNVPASLRI